MVSRSHWHIYFLNNSRNGRFTIFLVLSNSESLKYNIPVVLILITSMSWRRCRFLFFFYLLLLLIIIYYSHSVVVHISD